MADTRKFPKPPPLPKSPSPRRKVATDESGPEEPYRFDDWQNALTGFGVFGQDKRLGSRFNACLMTQEEAEEIWRGDDIIARIIETVPNEMLREGYEVSVSPDEENATDAGEDPSTDSPHQPGQPKKDALPTSPSPDFKAKPVMGPDAAAQYEAKPKATANDDSKDIAEDMDAEHRRLDVVEALRRACWYERAYGGGALLLGIDDGSKNLELPLNEKSIKTFDWLSVLTPRELRPVRYYSNPLKQKYGEVAVYALVPIDSPPGALTANMPMIHESRLIRFGGVRVSRGAILRNTLPGWGDSILVRLLQVVKDFQGAWQGVGILLTDFAPMVMKIKGLAKLLAAQNANDQSLVSRARAIKLAQSIANVTILDSEEEFERKGITIAGLPELLDKVILRTAAAAQMPVSLLMGQAPAGLNATGDSDIRWFYDQISAMQERQLRPALLRLTRLMFLSKAGPTKGVEPENWDLKFNPLWQLTEAETATARLAIAQADALYVANQVVTPQEIARSRFGGDGYSMDTTIDTDLRDALDNPDDAAVQLGAGAAADKQQAADIAKKAAENPAPVAGKGPPPAGKGK